MKKDEFGVVTFKSTHHAIQGESIFKKREINFRTIPTPREITVSCGLAIKFDLSVIDRVKEMIEENELDFDGVYKYVKNNGNYSAERII
jgi:hypothetical protein